MNIGLITYVYEDYQDFIPLFVYSTLKNNPNLNIKIFLKEELTKENRTMLEKVSTNKVCVVENYFRPCPIEKLGGIRILIPEKDVSEFDYIYLTDVDIVEMDDMTKQCETDILKANERGVPFNGVSYRTEFHTDNSPPVTLPRFNMGCVFIDVKPYYEKMTRVIEEINSSKHQEYMDKIKHLQSDELLFYYMLKQAFEFDETVFKHRDLPGKNLCGVKWGFDNKWVPTDDVEKALIEDIYENGTEQIKSIFTHRALIRLKTL